MMKKAVLLLESGEMFVGRAVGADGERIGEVVFNTSMTGYQEILSDPSYKGQIVVMTNPHIGNYGVNDEDMESNGLWLEGFAVGECCMRPSNHRSRQPLPAFLEKHRVVAIDQIDTRRLTRLIRSDGAKPGIISTNDFSKESLLLKLKQHGHPVEGHDLVAKVTCSAPYKWGDKADGRAGSSSRGISDTGAKYRVAVYDFGVKYNILRLMEKHGMELEIFPAGYDPAEILDQQFDGLFLSNGPGDPSVVKYAINNVRQLLGKIPIFGICLGNQILGLALGGAVQKLAFGHHGGNQPVRAKSSRRVEITAQNHNYVADLSSLPHAAISGETDEVVYQTDHTRVSVSHRNLNDNSVEGLECLDIAAFSVQYHPESSPGPHDSEYLFEKFKTMIAKS